MTVVAIFMTLCSTVYHALTTTTSVPSPPRSPSELAGDPAYLGSAVGTPHPVTAPFLQKQNLTTRTVKSLPFLDQIVHPNLGFPRVFIH